MQKLLPPVMPIMKENMPKIYNPTIPLARSDKCDPGPSHFKLCAISREKKMGKVICFRSCQMEQ